MQKNENKPWKNTPSSGHWITKKQADESCSMICVAADMDAETAPVSASRSDGPNDAWHNCRIPNIPRIMLVSELMRESGTYRGAKHLQIYY